MSNSLTSSSGSAISRNTIADDADRAVLVNYANCRSLGDWCDKASHGPVPITQSLTPDVKPST